MAFRSRCPRHLPVVFGVLDVPKGLGRLVVSVCLLVLLMGCGSSQNPADQPASSSEAPPSAAGTPSEHSTQSPTGEEASPSESTGSTMAPQVVGVASSAGQTFPSLSFPHLGTSAAGSQVSSNPVPEVDISSNPIVQVDTNFGSFRIELDRQKAPITTENFLNYVERGQYDQTIIHQVFPKAVIVGGGYTVRGEPIKAGPPILNEAHNGLKNLRGTVAMYRDPADPHSATSIFFINVKDNPAYDHRGSVSAGGWPTGLGSTPPEDYGYCVFGRVIQGMEVVDKIASIPVHDTERFERTPIQPVIVHSIRWIK